VTEMPMIFGILFALFTLTVVLRYLLPLTLISTGNKWQSVTECNYWQQQQVEHLSDGSLLLAQGRLTMDKGNPVLDLVGTAYAMGFQHGCLLHDDIRRGVLSEYAQPLQEIPAFSKLPRWLQLLAQWYLDMRVYAPLERHAPQELLSELKGLADGAKLPYRDVFRANFLSDMKMVMLPSEVKRQKGLMNQLAECTSVVVSGSECKNGHLLVGRNTDYVGGDRWCLQQVILRYQPSKGYSYVSITSAGMLKCNSAMNQHGLVLGGHFMGFSGANSAGISFTFLEHLIMRSCRTVAEANELMQEQRVAGSFAFALASPDEPSLLIEAGAHGIATHGMTDDQMVVTNCAQTDKYRSLDLMSINGIMSANIQGRLKRAQTWLGEQSGKTTPADLAQLMGDRSDAFCGNERSCAATLGFKDNVTSVVFEPATLRYWVATGAAPICDNKYQSYHFHSKTHEPPLQPYQWQVPSRLTALRRWLHMQQSSKKNDRSYCEIELQACVALDPGGPRYRFELAQLHLENYRAAQALLALNPMQDDALSPSELSRLWLLRGLAHQQLSNSAEANDCFDIALVSVSQPVVEADKWPVESNRLLTGLVKKAQAGKHNGKLLSSLNSELFG